MSKTIEEIALHIAQELGATKANKEQSIYRACIRMAHEQKAIYDKAMDMLNEACDNTIMLEKQNMIDKACKSFCKRCVHNQTIKKCMYLGKDCPLIGAFRKDLEE